MNLCEGRIELFEGNAERPRKRVRRGLQRGRMGAENSEIEFAVEEGHPLAVGRQPVPVRVRLPVNHGDGTLVTFLSWFE